MAILITYANIFAAIDVLLFLAFYFASYEKCIRCEYNT